MLKKTINFVKNDIWKAQLKEIPLIRAIFLRYTRLFLLAVTEFNKDNCPLKASALTYYSMIAVVPVFAIVFWIAQGFGLEKFIENQVMNQALWQADVGNEIVSLSNSLLEHVKGGLMAWIGFSIVFSAIFLIFWNMEKSFNEIWDVKKQRKFLRKLLDYSFLIVIAPLLFIISSTFTVVATSEVKEIVYRTAFLGSFGPILIFFSRFLRYFSIWTLLMLFYYVLPNVRVPVKSCILAGIAAGTIFQIVQKIYIEFQLGVTSYGALYGSFAALPLFLMWLQLSWMIILFGSEIAFADTNIQSSGFAPNYSNLSQHFKKVLMLNVLHLIVKKSAANEKAMNARQISKELGIPQRFVRNIIYEMELSGLIVENNRLVAGEPVFNVAGDINSLTIKEAVTAYENHGSSPCFSYLNEDAKRISLYLEKMSVFTKEFDGNILLKDV